jgi:hypothetical protein
VKVQGEAAGSADLRTPATELPCLAVQWTVEERQGRVRKVVERGGRRLPFELAEGAARVPVVAANAVIEIEPLRMGQERQTVERAVVPGASLVIYGVARRSPGLELVAHRITDPRTVQAQANTPRWHVALLVSAWVCGAAAVMTMLAAVTR